MRVGVVGAGVMGTALARLLHRAGHEIMLGSRRNLCPENGFRLGSYAEAVQFGKIVVLATVWQGTREAIAQCGSLRDRVLVDATNPENESGRSLTLPGQTSGAEQVAFWAEGARVVKAFNHVYAELLDSGPSLAGQQVSVFYCGDDRRAKSEVHDLIAEVGFEPVDSGPLASSRTLEALAALMVELVRRQGHAPPDVAFKLLRRLA